MTADGHGSSLPPSVGVAALATAGDWVRQAHREYVITPWTRQDGSDPVPVAGGLGCWFWDYEGRRYLDFESQLVNLNLGFQHPRVVEAIQKQAETLCYVSPAMGNAARSRLAELVAEVTPEGLKKSFFTSGGAEAVENAIRLARHYTGRHKVFARYRSYHGGTAGALSATGDPRRWGAEPGMPGVVRLLDPYIYRCPAGHPSPCPICSGAPHLEEILAYENPETVAAVILETVTGTNGIIVPPDGYLQSVEATCRKYGIMLVLDEVMVGFGRTGRWFACDHWNVTPDILCVAKGINSGYVPLGAIVVSEEIAAWLDENAFPGGLTYSAHPLACASGVASIEAMREEGVVENAARQGEHLCRRLSELWGAHPSIGDVRGRGLFYGVELVQDATTRTPFVPFNAKGGDAEPMRLVLDQAWDRGLYLSAFSNVIRIAPPLIIDREDLELGLSILDEVLLTADRLAG